MKPATVLLALLLCGCGATMTPGVNYAQNDGAALGLRWHLALGGDAPAATDDSDDGDDE
jgi:hypothetical protein